MGGAAGISFNKGDSNGIEAPAPGCNETDGGSASDDGRWTRREPLLMAWKRRAASQPQGGSQPDERFGTGLLDTNNKWKQEVGEKN